MKKLNMLACAMVIATQIFAQTISTFENLTLPVDSFWDGSDLSGGFASGNAYFVNDYSTSFMSWSGFTYSNKQDTATPGYGNQYSTITGGGYAGSANYAIADEYGNAKVRLTGNAEGKPVKGFYINNTTYAYLSMRDGDAFAKKFGGASGTDPDWFRLRVLGWSNGALKAQSVDFFLADFRAADSTQDYIVRDWTWLDLQTLGNVDSILFNLSSSDTAFGYMNTPAYFALDNFTTTDQPNAAPVAADDYVIITYLNDTLIPVLANDLDTTATPLTVELLGLPLIPGATDTVINNEILYTPAVGIVATDTLYYRVCDAMQSCDTGRVIVNVTSLTGVGNTITSLNASVYPSPFSNQLIISASALSEERSVSVYDAYGRMVMADKLFGVNQTLSTDTWSAGIYFIKLSSGAISTVKKVVKE